MSNFRKAAITVRASLFFTVLYWAFVYFWADTSIVPSAYEVSMGFDYFFALPEWMQLAVWWNALIFPIALTVFMFVGTKAMNDGPRWKHHQLWITRCAIFFSSVCMVTLMTGMTESQCFQDPIDTLAKPYVPLLGLFLPYIIAFLNVDQDIIEYFSLQQRFWITLPASIGGCVVTALHSGIITGIISIGVCVGAIFALHTGYWLLVVLFKKPVQLAVQFPGKVVHWILADDLDEED